MLESRGQRLAANQSYKDAIKLAPTVPYAYYRYGIALLARGDLASAEVRFTEAHRRGPKWADPLKGLGDIRSRQGRWEDAARYYRNALKFAPEWTLLKNAQSRAASQI